MVSSTPAVTDLSAINDSASPSSPFEGPEKLLEVWFTPSEDGLADHPTRGTRLSVSGDQFGSRKLTGLRTISHEIWHDMLKLVKCQVLSVIEEEELDAYLLSESSMFVWPHKIILKTCGTTTLLLGIHRLLEIAREKCGFPGVWRLFYSRKTYMFPERQKGPHKTWEQEKNFLDEIFSASSAYTVGKSSADHWFLYLTAQQQPFCAPNQLKGPLLKSSFGNDLSLTSHLDQNSLPILWRQHALNLAERDCTLEILMTGLSPQASQKFYIIEHPVGQSSDHMGEGAASGKALATSLGIDAPSLIGKGQTDGYLFSPCGLSINMVGGSDKKRYATIHVTPEQNHCFASFESNVDYSDPKENLIHVVTRIVNVFEPKKMIITLFESHVQGETSVSHTKSSEVLGQHLPDGYKRVDQILYHLDGYNLKFVSFERLEHQHHDS